MVLKVSLAAATDTTHRADRNRNERRVLEVGDPDSDIYPLLDKADHSVKQHQFCPNPGMLHEKSSQQEGNVALTESHRGRDRELPVQLAATRNQEVFRFLDGGQNEAAMLKILGAFIREMDAPRRALEQQHPELTLETR